MLLAFAYERIEKKQEISEDMFILNELGTPKDYLKIIQDLSSKTILMSCTTEEQLKIKEVLLDDNKRKEIIKLLKKGD